MSQSKPALYFGKLLPELLTLYKIGRAKDPIRRIKTEINETSQIDPHYFKNNVKILYLKNICEVDAETKLFQELDKRGKRRLERKEMFYTTEEEIIEILDTLGIDYEKVEFITAYESLVSSEIIKETIHDNKKLKVNYDKRMDDKHKDRCEKLVELDLTIGEIIIRNNKNKLSKKVNFECYNQVKSTTKSKYRTSDFKWDVENSYLVLDE